MQNTSKFYIPKFAAQDTIFGRSA